ncbi:uncharacterized protein EV420DRAFT_154423 [Desarmillaria tabescens]|uniref:Peptidase C14 caspase domain-containing protein n=1 Tax=Armillaria tabescens TaxID=1929756 RepID=A0AA39J8B6_ARMTA|nr:uncharacterized protein EV420DRAFT_154423 [Desarmillaria tabescens]KAK0437903.1 hypothetical protein EV420DRAFT_154423 [Desarmillaria tabescens]
MQVRPGIRCRHFVQYGRIVPSYDHYGIPCNRYGQHMLQLDLGYEVTPGISKADGQRAMLSQLKQISGEIQSLEELEMRVAQQLGMSEDADSAEILLKTKQDVMNNSDCLSAALKKLNRLYYLRLCSSRIQSKLRVGNPDASPLPLGPPRRVDASQFWAVLIGIDEYASYPLLGCVSDARLMEKYLIENLDVPGDRIQLLLGSTEHTSSDHPMNPSRTRIIHTLLSIIGNSQIKYGDNIIIYYAGHGSCYPCTEGLYNEEDDEKLAVEETGFIEALCPIDRDTVDSNGVPIPDISDRELNTILTLISQAKGSRITVILDCCHSGGITRDLPVPGARTTPRMVRATLQDMLLAGEKNLKHYPSYRSILAKDWRPNMDCFVALTACGDYQFAKAKKVEGGYIGLFTDSLVRTLQSGYWKEETTYADLVRDLDKWPHQTPCAVGNRKDARIWYQD